MASYPGQIPAGGEDIIRIKVNTRGYGGRQLNKQVVVYTNDPDQERIALTISGTVNDLVTLSPARVQLTGAVGSDIHQMVSITSDASFPFRIVDVKATYGENIAFDLKPILESGKNAYCLSVKNTKRTEGRYSDTLTLTTDSPIRPQLTVRVYGNIFLSPASTTR